MYTESLAVQKYRPPVYPVEQGHLLTADGTIEVTAADIALNALVGLVILPAGCVPIDFTLIEDDLDTGTALVQDVGVLNSTEDDLVASTNLITGATVGQAGGAARADALPDALCTPSESDRVIAVKTTTGGVLVATATGTITSSGVNVTAADTVTINSKAYTFRDAIYPATVKATGTVTSSGVNVTADDTVTINGKAYKFVEAPTSEGDVNIGVSAEDTLANLFYAINHSGTPDTDYKCAVAHPTVIASNVTATVLTLEAITGGTGGNSLTLAKSAATLTVSDEHLTGGITISAEGDVLIGGSAAETLDNLKLAINRTEPATNDGVKYKIAAAHPTVSATTNTDTVQTLAALTAGADGNSLTLAKSAATLTLSHDHLEGGVDAVPLQAGTIRGILQYRSACYGV